MNKDINEYLASIEPRYDVSKEYIEHLYQELKIVLKPVYKKYKLKRKIIYKYIYEYFENQMNIDNAVIEVSKLNQPAQRSEEWYNMRYNMITASEAASVVGKKTTNTMTMSEFEKIIVKPAYKSKDELMKVKVLKNDVFKGNAMTKHGQIFEQIAVIIYENKNKIRILEFGLIQHKTNLIIGASPDGITQNSIMIEIKSPSRREITGKVPLNYWVQMQFQLEVCNLENCDFVEVKTTRYESKEEYDDDVFDDDDALLSSLGLEKGIIIECKNYADTLSTYIYPDNETFKSKNKINTWLDEKLVQMNSEYDYVDVLYWRLEKYSCVRINRDRSWFNTNLELFEDFWKNVLINRENKEAFLKSIEKKPRVKKKIEPQPEKCMIIDSSDDEQSEKASNILDSLVSPVGSINETTTNNTVNENSIDEINTEDIIYDL